MRPPPDSATYGSDCLTALPAKMSALNSCVRENAYYRNLKCIFEDLLPCYYYATKANGRTIRSRVSQPASAGKEADLVNCKLITACYQNSETDSCAVWLSHRQINCHCKNYSQLPRGEGPFFLPCARPRLRNQTVKKCWSLLTSWRKLHIVQPFIYYLRKHHFSFLCYSSKPVYTRGAQSAARGKNFYALRQGS